MRNAREPEQCAAAAAALDIVEKMTKLPGENLMEYSKESSKLSLPSFVVCRFSSQRHVSHNNRDYVYVYVHYQGHRMPIMLELRLYTGPIV